MKSPLDQLLATAKTISLDQGERQAMAQALGIRVRERHTERLQPYMSEKQFFRIGKKVSLSPSEKAVSKEYVLHRLESRSPWWTFSFKSFTALIAAALIVVIGGASASYAAESAVPGDFLYPVKIHVNEEVKTTLMKDKEASARWQAKRAERRLKEAETLADRSAFTDAARLSITENFRKHARAVKAQVAVLQAENNEAAGAVRMDFEASLRAHALLLGTIGDEQSDQAATIDVLMSDVQEARLDTEEDNVLATLKKTPVANIVHTDSTLNRARAEVAAAKKNFRGDAGSAEQKLESARQALDDAEKTENVEQRMKKAREALRTAKEIELLGTKNAAAVDKKTSLFDNGETANQTRKSKVENDTAFNAEVRMRITKRELKTLGEDIKHKPISEDAAIRTETQMIGAQQLLDIAKMQMEAGEDSHALEASDMALKHAEEAKATAKENIQFKVDALQIKEDVKD